MKNIWKIGKQKKLENKWKIIAKITNFGRSPAGFQVRSGSGSGRFNRTRSPVPDPDPESGRTPGPAGLKNTQSGSSLVLREFHITL